MAVYFPEDYSAVMLPALYAAVKRGAGSVTVAWAKQRTAGESGVGVPTVAAPYVTIDVLVPPRQVGQLECHRLPAVRFTAPTEDPATYALTIDGDTFTVEHDGTTYGSATEVRDAMLDAIEADGEVLAVTAGSDGLAVAGAKGRALSVPEDGPASLWLAEYYFAESTATFSIDAVTRFPDSAAALSAAVRLGLETILGLEVLQAGGWGYNSVPSVREGDKFFAALWEDRSGFDIRLNCKSRRIEFVPWIDEVAIFGTIESVGTIESATIVGQIA